MNFINSFVLAAIYTNHKEQLSYLNTSEESDFLKVEQVTSASEFFTPALMLGHKQKKRKNSPGDRATK